MEEKKEGRTKKNKEKYQFISYIYKTQSFLVNQPPLYPQEPFEGKKEREKKKEEQEKKKEVTQYS